MHHLMCQVDQSDFGVFLYVNEFSSRLQSKQKRTFKVTFFAD